MKLLPSRHVLCIPYNYAPCYFMLNCIHNVYMFCCNLSPVFLAELHQITSQICFLFSFGRGGGKGDWGKKYTHGSTKSDGRISSKSDVPVLFTTVLTVSVSIPSHSPMIQKTAEPAPASQKRGKERAPTTAYCWARLSSRPAPLYSQSMKQCTLQKPQHTHTHNCTVIQ